MEFADLLRAAKAGDEDAVDSLLRQAWEYLVAAGKISVRPPLKQRFSESDAMQDTLMRIFQKLSSFNGTTEGEWKAWLTRIADNVIADAGRHERAQKRDINRQTPIEHPIGSDVSGPSGKVERLDSVAQAEAIISGLPDEQQVAFRMRYTEGAKIAEISESLGKTQDAVAGLLRRALKAIRSQMNGDSRPGP